MAEVTGYALSHHLSDLVGRKVEFKQATVAVETARAVYGIYNVLPDNTPVVVKTDLALLGSFAGLLVGLPDEEVKQRLKVSPIEELLRDAMYEVLNITSTVVTTEGRAVFGRMVTDVAYVDGQAGEVLKKPGRRSYFNVSVEGYQGGRFTVLSPILAVKIA